MIVYTAHFGDTDPLLDPLETERGVEYLCFTDRTDLQSKVWEIRHLEPIPDMSPRERARWIKILWPLKKTPVSMWVDGTYQLKRKPSDIVGRHLEEHHVLAMPHPFRDNIKDEAKIVTEVHGGDPQILEQQIFRYAADGFDPEGMTHLTTTGLLIRRHTGVVEDFSRRWLMEVLQWSLRDQMSVDYCAWKAGIKIGLLYGHYRRNKYADWYRHGGIKPAKMRISRCEAPGREFVNHARIR